MSDEDFLGQAPDRLLDRFEFTTSPISDPDFLIVLNRSPEPIRVQLPTSRVWCLLQEPPNSIFRPMHRGCSSYGRIYSSMGSVSRRHVRAAPFIPWFVQGTHPDFISLRPPILQNRSVACITSTSHFFPSHAERLRCLKMIAERCDVKIFGRGYRGIRSKSEVYRQFQYALVAENSVFPDYWTEKISDALLEWNLPFYSGCPNIVDYFPSDAIVPLDIASDDAAEIIKNAICADLRNKRIDAIAEARKVILERYNIFDFIAGQIDEFLKDEGPSLKPESSVTIPSIYPAVLETWGRVLLRRLSLRCFREPHVNFPQHCFDPPE